MNIEYRMRLLELKKLLKKFIKKGYFKLFDSMDLFYLFDPTSRSILFFSDRIFNDSFGMQFFYGDAGINYLHDAFTTKDNFAINPFFVDTILLSMVSKKDIIPEDVEYLHRYKINITELNFIPYRYQEGYPIRYLNIKELDIVLKYCYYLDSLIENEKDDIIKAFAKEDIVLSMFHPKEYLYEVRYGTLANIETFPKKRKANQQFILDNQLLPLKEDTWHLLHAYLPNDSDNKQPYPTLLMLYSEQQDQFVHQVISCKPKKIVDYIEAFLDDSFKEHGLPTNLVINHRAIFSYMFETLKGLNIDVSFARENKELDEKIYDLFEDILAGDGNSSQKSFNVNYVS